MSSQLTFPVALFFLLVLVPAYVREVVSGRLEEARQKFYPVLYHGAMNFAVVFCWLYVLELAFRFFGIHFLPASMLLEVLQGRSVPNLALLLFVWFLAFYGVAIVLGLLQFISDLKAIRWVKVSAVWRNFFLRGVPFEASPRDDIFWDIFLCYRAIGKRPVASVKMEGGEVLRGEVIKVSWGLTPGILIEERAFPACRLIWVPLGRIVTIGFENPGIVREGSSLKLEAGTRNLLNLIHPGYGNEVEKRFREASQK